MPGHRKRYDAAFKAKVAIEAIKAQRTVNEIAAAYQIHPHQVTEWKKQALQQLSEVFSNGRVRAEMEDEELRNQLYQEIGRLKMELEWLKKNLDSAVKDRRLWIDPTYHDITIARQCELLGLPRSSYYYQPQGETAENLDLMRMLDEQYTLTPFYGIRRMTAWLRSLGKKVNHKRVARLLHLMGLETIYPKPRLSVPDAQHKIYPYLLRGVDISRPDQVWSTDITYVRLRAGYVYLVAVMDWFSRYVLSWEVSVSMESEFCISALDRALKTGKPEIFNSDQGSQFTSIDFIRPLKVLGVRISMDGRGRALDNVFVERLWRTVKYEEVYLKDYPTVPLAVDSLREFFRFYNQQRLHQSLGYKTPESVYYSRGGRN